MINRRRVMTALGLAGAGALTLTPALTPAEAASRPATLIRGARIFDGRRLLGPGHVLIRGGRIIHVGSRFADFGGGVAVVDGTGHTLLPGLVDAHSHMRTVEEMRRALAHGVTTELDMFTFPVARLTELRAAAAARPDLADLRSAGILASAPGGFPGSGLPDLPTLGGPADAEPFVAARQREGSDYIKILVEDRRVAQRPALAPETVAAVAAAARRRGLRTIAHAITGGAVDIALDAGVDAITHIPMDAPLDARRAARFARQRTIAIPTLTMMRAAAPDHYAVARAGAAALRAAGVPILAGTDATAGGPGIPAAIPHGEAMHTELALLVDAGLSPAAALTAGTAEPAHRFGLTDRGRIAPGLRADLLLVAGDPTTTIADTRRIRAVWRGGTRLP